MTVIALVRCNGRVRRKPLTVIFVTDTCVTRSIFTSFRLIDKRYSKCEYKEAHIMHMFAFCMAKLVRNSILVVYSSRQLLARWPHPTVEMRSNGIFNSIENNQRLKPTEKYWVTQLPWNASAEIKFFKNILEHRFSGKTTKRALFTEINYDALKFSFP